jgi:hypothetical protein
LGDGKRVTNPGLTGAFTCVETVYITGSSDVKKSSRLKDKSADARSWMQRKKLYQTGLAPVMQKASVSDNNKEYLD